MLHCGLIVAGAPSGPIPNRDALAVYRLQERSQPAPHHRHPLVELARRFLEEIEATPHPV
jgi:hypothetical protein